MAGSGWEAAGGAVAAAWWGVFFDVVVDVPVVQVVANSGMKRGPNKVARSLRLSAQWGRVSAMVCAKRGVVKYAEYAAATFSLLYERKTVASGHG